MKPKIDIVGVNEALNSLMRVRNQIPVTVPDFLEKSGGKIAQIMKSEMPKKTGKFSTTVGESQSSPRTGEWKYEIGPKNKHYQGRPVGLTIEEGRRAGSPPPPHTALMARYGLTVGQAIKAAQTISQRGVDPNPFAERTLKRSDEVIWKYAIEATKQIVGKF